MTRTAKRDQFGENVIFQESEKNEKNRFFLLVLKFKIETLWRALSNGAIIIAIRSVERKV